MSFKARTNLCKGHSARPRPSYTQMGSPAECGCGEACDCMECVVTRMLEEFIEAFHDERESGCGPEDEVSAEDIEDAMQMIELVADDLSREHPDMACELDDVCGVMAKLLRRELRRESA